MRKMSEFIREIDDAPTLPFFVRSFAKAASGGKSASEDDEDDDDEDDEDDDDEDDDPDADKTDDELREELKKTRSSLAKANGQSAKRRKALRLREAELIEARKPKPKKKGDDDDEGEHDLDSIRHEAKAEGERAGTTRAKKAEAKAALLAAGVNPARVTKATGLIDLEDLDLDDDGLDGIDEAIDDLRKDWPELFARQRRQRRDSVAGEGDRGDRKPRTKAKTASEKAAEKLLGRS